jgi:hypothetical protein
MLTDAALRSLTPKDKAYKVADRDGLYVYVLTSGTISFRFNYAINGRQETLVLGRYGPGGLKLSEARELLVEAKRAVAAGRSPARQKATVLARRREENTFGEWAEEWLQRYTMAESTRDMRRSVYERDLKRPFGRLKLEEITAEELRAAMRSHRGTWCAGDSGACARGGHARIPLCPRPRAEGWQSGR